LSLAARTTTPRPRTKIRNDGSAARASARAVVVRRTSAGTVIAAAPAAATHAGAIPSAELTAKPASVSPTTASAKRGSGGRSSAAARARRGRPRSTAKKRVSTIHSTATAPAVGSAMSPAKRVNDSPLAWKASRLVRLETGSSSDAELARCEQA
jgi:hypothetical protein